MKSTYLVLAITALAAGEVRADEKLPNIKDLSVISTQLGLKLNGRSISSYFNTPEDLRRVFSSKLTRPGYRGVYRLQIEPTGTLSVYYGGGTMPDGRRADSGTYRNSRWISHTARISGSEAGYRVELFVSRIFELPVPQRSGKSEKSVKPQKSDHDLFIVDGRNNLPTILMREVSGARPVTKSDLETITKAIVQWDDKDASELKRLTRFSRLREVRIGRGTLRFPNLVHLSALPLTGLFAGRHCEVLPQYLSILERFPQLERLDIDFGLNGIAQTMRAIEVRELEVLRKLPKLRELNIAGYGITSRVAPRLCDHPNLEILHFGTCSVGVRGPIELTGLPKLSSLRLSDFKDRHIHDVLRLENLQVLEASAEELTLEGFAALRGLTKLNELRLSGFWVPGDQLKFLRELDTYTSVELEVVAAVHALQFLTRQDKDLESSRQQILRYGTAFVGTADEGAKRAVVREANQLVLQALKRSRSGASLKRQIAQKALTSAATSTKPDFADRIHAAIERCTGMEFSKPSRSRRTAKVGASLSNSLGMQFRQIAAGSFTHEGRSGEKGIGRVTQPYFLGVHEVTQGQFTKVTGANPVRRFGALAIGKDLPVS